MISSATTAAWPSANTPALGVPTLVTSPTAYTPGQRRRQRERVDRDPAVDAHPRLGDDRRAHGARARRGTGRTASRCRRRSGRPCAPGRARAPGGSGATRCRARRTPRGCAFDASGDGGIGTGSGMTSAISDRSRSPRSVRKSCISSAVSLGAGGHLNGVDVTPTTTRPPSKAAEHVARRRTPRPPCRTRGRPRPGRASPPGRGRRRGRPPSRRRRTDPASVSTRSRVGVDRPDRRSARTARPA